VVVLVSVGASAVATRLTGRLARGLGLADAGPGHWLLAGAGFVIAVGADLLLLLYLLASFPGVEGQHRRDLLTAALIGAVGFEVLKLALSSYLGYVAGRSLYGAFGTPVALLLWINFINRLLLYCVAWTATADPAQARVRARALAKAAYREAAH
jgi:membrane protein